MRYILELNDAELEILKRKLADGYKGGWLGTTNIDQQLYIKLQRLLPERDEKFTQSRIPFREDRILAESEKERIHKWDILKSRGRY